MDIDKEVVQPMKQAGYFHLKEIPPTTDPNVLFKVRMWMELLGFEGGVEEFIEKYNAGEFPGFKIIQRRKCPCHD